MKRFLLMLPLLVAACATGSSVPANIADLPNKRKVDVDDHAIYVAKISSREYAGWGGENDRDGFIQYRQKRAIELVSGCRISSTSTKKTDDWTRANVKC